MLINVMLKKNVMTFLSVLFRALNGKCVEGFVSSLFQKSIGWGEEKVVNGEGKGLNEKNNS